MTINSVNAGSASPTSPPLTLTASRSPALATNANAPPPAATNPTQASLKLLSDTQEESSVRLDGKRDLVLTNKLNDVWTKLQQLIATCNGTEPDIRTFTGKDAGEITVAIYHIDTTGQRQLFRLSPQDTNYTDYTELKTKMRELHRELIGIPTQTQAFQGIHIPNFTNDFLHFFQSGHFDKINQFIAENGLTKELPPQKVFGRIAAAHIWIKTALLEIDPLIQIAAGEVQRLEQAAATNDRKALAAKRAHLRELQSVAKDLRELSQGTHSARPQKLMLNWVMGMNDTLGNFDRAKLTQQGILHTLAEEDDKIAKESSFDLRTLHLNPFGKKGADSLPEPARKEYSHSAAALTLYHDEPTYIKWCDEAGRHMKSDSTARLVITHILSALGPRASQASSPIQGAHITSACNTELTLIFDRATSEAQQVYASCSYNTSPPDQQWQDWGGSALKKTTPLLLP